MLKNFSKRDLAFISVVVAALIGGATPVFIKIAVSEIPPLSFTFLRFLFSSILVLPFFLREKSKIKGNILSIVPLSLLATANVTLFAFGVNLTTASIGQMLYVTVPIIAAILSYFFLKEKITSKKVLGVALGFSGALIIIALPLIGTSAFSGNLAGNLIVFTGVLSFSTYTVFSKKAQKIYSPLSINAAFFFTTAIVSFLLLLLAGFNSNVVWWNSLSTMAIIATSYVVVVSTFIFFLLYQYAIKHGTPLIASTINYIQVVATLGWAFVLLGEQLTAGFILGAILVSAGAWIISRAKV